MNAIKKLLKRVWLGYWLWPVWIGLIVFSLAPLLFQLFFSLAFLLIIPTLVLGPCLGLVYAFLVHKQYTFWGFLVAMLLAIGDGVSAVLIGIHHIAEPDTILTLCQIALISDILTGAVAFCAMIWQIVVIILRIRNRNKKD